MLACICVFMCLSYLMTARTIRRGQMARRGNNWTQKRTGKFSIFVAVEWLHPSAVPGRPNLLLGRWPPRSYHFRCRRHKKPRPPPHRGQGVNSQAKPTYSQVGECLVELCHQGWRSLAEELPRALRCGKAHQEPWLTGKLANAGGRCWKDTLGRMRSIRSNRPPYPTRQGV